MNDQDLQLKLDADSIANRLFVDYSSAKKPQLLPPPHRPVRSVPIPEKAPEQTQQIPACSSGLVVTDIRVPWNSVARLVAQAVAAFILLALAISGVICTVIWALRCV